MVMVCSSTFFVGNETCQPIASISQQLQDIKLILQASICVGSPHNPATSCKLIKEAHPLSVSAYYWIRDSSGHVSQQYCDMERQGCGTTGGWMRVANLDMTDPNQNCPPGLRLITSPKRLCGRPGPRGCVSVTYNTLGIPYSKVCGRVIGYQDKSPDGFIRYIISRTSIDQVYADGVSITHGSPRQHIWTFVCAHSERTTVYHRETCPCISGFTGTVPPYIGQNYFCDTGSHNPIGIGRFFTEDPLWDGEGCGPLSTCCSFNSPPWFCTELNQITSDDIELRLCGDESTSNEDTPLETIELYVQ